MNKIMKLAALLAFLAGFSSQSAVAAADQELEKADIDPAQIPSLQRGARNFMNYCSGCHSARYVRFNTIGKYLELSDEQLVDNLMFNAEKTFETIRTAMPPEQAERWFGIAPPDLSLLARSKGADYIYTFLKSFYVEEESPTGVNNIVMPHTSMPHVLWELQGYQTAIFTEHKKEDDEGNVITTTEFEGFEKFSEGTLDEEDYDDFVRDTVNFLAYVSEPIRAERRKIGTWVIMYLVVFLIIAYMLKKQIWKDVN